MLELRRTGRLLRTLRRSKQLRPADVAQLSEGVLSAHQVSELEAGAVEQPPMRDLVAYGRILDLTPNDVAELYGWWQEPGQAPMPEDAHIAQARRVAERLPPDVQTEFYHWLDFAVAYAAEKALLPFNDYEGAGAADQDDENP